MQSSSHVFAVQVKRSLAHPLTPLNQDAIGEYTDVRGIKEYNGPLTESKTRFTVEFFAVLRLNELQIVIVTLEKMRYLILGLYHIQLMLVRVCAL
jgi:hypothetical protein